MRLVSLKIKRAFRILRQLSNQSDTTLRFYKQQASFVVYTDGTSRPTFG